MCRFGFVKAFACSEGLRKRTRNDDLIMLALLAGTVRSISLFWAPNLQFSQLWLKTLLGLAFKRARGLLRCVSQEMQYGYPPAPLPLQHQARKEQGVSTSQTIHHAYCAVASCVMFEILSRRPCFQGRGVAPAGACQRPAGPPTQGLAHNVEVSSDGCLGGGDLQQSAAGHPSL